MDSEEYNFACSHIDMFNLCLTFFENIKLSKKRLLDYKISNNDDYRKMFYELLDFLNSVYTYKEFLANEKYPICKIIHESYYDFKKNDKGNKYRFLLEYRNILIHDHIIPRFYTKDGDIVLNTNDLRKYFKYVKKKKYLDQLIKKVYRSCNIKLGNDYVFLFEIISGAYEEINSMFHEITFHLYDSLIEDALEIFIQNNKRKNTNDIQNICGYMIKFFAPNSQIYLSIVKLMTDNDISFV